MNPGLDPAASRAALPSGGGYSPADAHGLAREVYEETVSRSRNLLENSEHLDEGIFSGIAANVGRLTALLKEDNQHLLALTARTTPGNYLYGHCANVTVLSLRLGVCLDWDEESLRVLGTASMLHDLGLKHWLSLGMLDRRLSSDELRQLRLHRGETVRLVGQSHGVDAPTLASVGAILRQARVEGPVARRPRGLSELAHKSSQILAVCDLFESMSHLRNWRKPMTPHDAVKRVLKLSRDQFDIEIVKLLVSQMTLYPPGSYVRLRSGEVGRVIQVDPLFPMRPLVMFILDAEGRSLRLPWYADLRHQPLLHIAAAVDETSLEIEDLRLKAVFEADRWWL